MPCPIKRGDRRPVERSPEGPDRDLSADQFGVVAKQRGLIPNSDPPSIKPTSRNPRYESCERPLADAVVNARVIGKWPWT